MPERREALSNIDIDIGRPAYTMTLSLLVAFFFIASTIPNLTTLYCFILLTALTNSSPVLSPATVTGQSQAKNISLHSPTHYSLTIRPIGNLSYM